jgi:hypothetical protein
MHGASKRWRLTVAQQETWLVQQRNPGSPDLVIAESLEIRGPIDVAVFQSAYVQATAESNLAGLQIVTDNGVPWQTVNPERNTRPRFVDVRSAPDPHAAADCLIAGVAGRPMDFDGGELMTMMLVQRGDEDFLAYGRVHHIYTDGFGYETWLNRMAEIYSTIVAGRPAPVAPLPTLDDVLADEDAYHTSEQFRQDREFWAGQFEGQDDVVTLAGTTAPASSETHVAEKELCVLASRQLRTLARDSGVALSALLLAVTALYVRRQTGGAEAVLGLLVQARRGSSVRSTPIAMAQTLPLRLTAPDAATIKDVARLASQKTRDLLRHERYRSRDLRNDRKTSTNGRRLFGTSVNIPPLLDDPRLGRAEVINRRRVAHGVVEDLQITFFNRDAASPLGMEVAANPATYSAQDTGDHLRRLLRLLETVAQSRPDSRLSTVPVALPSEQD